MALGIINQDLKRGLCKSLGLARSYSNREHKSTHIRDKKKAATNTCKPKVFFSEITYQVGLK